MKWDINLISVLEFHKHKIIEKIQYGKFNISQLIRMQSFASVG